MKAPHPRESRERGANLFIGFSVVTCDEFKIGLRMIAYRTLIRSFLSYYDMSAVPALPDHLSIS